MTDNNGPVVETKEEPPVETKPVTEKQEIAEKKSTAIAASSMFEEDAGSGLENVTAEDLTIPRLKILQALSPEVNKNDGK